MSEPGGSNEYRSRTARAERSWASSVQAFPCGAAVSGRVYRRERFGVFLDLDGDPEAHGFADIAGARCRRHGLPEVGTRISGRVRQHRDHNTQIVVALDWSAIHDPWRDFNGRVGDVVTGTVTSVAPIGVFVAVGECIEGLVPSEALSARPVSTARWAEGTPVRVRITELDADRLRLVFAPA
jgi:ribosomal protein S1